MVNSVYINSLLLWIVQFVVVSGALQDSCPSLPVWDGRAQELCDNPAWYHCLKNQADEIKESCVRPIYIYQGYFPIFSPDNSLIPRRCPSTHYQPSGQMSNQYKQVTCMYRKAECEDEGDEICDEGSDTSDRMCRCDYTRGYRSLQYLLNNPNHRSCYQPQFNERGCVMLSCEEGQELNPAYQCIPSCPTGYFRPKYDVNCIQQVPEFSSSTTAKAKIQIPDKESKEDVEYAVKDQFSKDNNVLIVFIVLSSLAAITISSILAFIIWKRKRNTHARQRNESDSESRPLREDEIHINELHVRGENIVIGSDNTIITKETSFKKNTSTNQEESGENLRKSQDNAFPYKEGEIIFRKKCGRSIGCITTGKGTGTGFRVGEKYILTAYHVVEDIFDHLWKSVYGRILKDGCWCLTNVIKSRNSNEQMKDDIEKIMKECKIKFGYTDENQGRVFQFSYDAPYVSVKHDIAILELISEAPDRPLPRALALASINLPHKLHVLGHPGGGELQFDPACDIIGDESTLSKIKSDAVDLYTSLGEKSSSVESWYSECELSQDHVLFNCAKSTTHGASGSPLIQVLENKPTVIGILLKGYPKMYYNKYHNDKRVNEHPELLIESGISMKMLRDLLIGQNLAELANELFKS